MVDTEMTHKYSVVRADPAGTVRGHQRTRNLGERVVGYGGG